MDGRVEPRREVRQIAAMPDIVGYCYTQLTDTMQEVNGLLTEDRKPKLPVETSHRILTKPAASMPHELLAAEQKIARERARRRED